MQPKTKLFPDSTPRGDGFAICTGKQRTGGGNGRTMRQDTHSCSCVDKEFLSGLGILEINEAAEGVKLPTAAA